jgi:hypothetical protein
MVSTRMLRGKGCLFPLKHGLQKASVTQKRQMKEDATEKC